MKKAPDFFRLIAGIVVTAGFVIPVSGVHAQLLGSTNSVDGLRKAIIVYSYTWEHDGGSQWVKFRADGGTEGRDGVDWRARNAQEVEIWHPGSPKQKMVIKFSQDYTSFTGADFQGNHLTGHQIIPKPGDKPQTPKPDSNNNGGNSAPGAFGSSNPTGGNAQPANQPPPSSPISPEMQQKASDFIKTYHNSLVFVTGKEGVGSGFIATLGASNFLFTNAHVEAGINDATFKTLDDNAVKGGQASVAVGRDIVCMAMSAGGTPLEIMQDVGSNAGIGDEVAVLGNAEGGGVINAITGKIVGVGPDRIEIDAPFVPGNSGSPIIHLKTGKVIGVATYLTINNYDTTTNEKNVKPVIRRFGYRLDNVKQWQAVNWTAFHAQALEMDKIETLTGDLYDFFRDISENKGGVTPGRHTNPVIKNRIDEWIANKGKNQSAEDQAMANGNFLSFLKVACQADVNAAKRDVSYDYFQRELAEQQQARDEMAKAFDEIIKSLRN